MIKNYYYFATHTSNESIYKFLTAGVLYKKMPQKEQELLDTLVKNYKTKDKNNTVLNFCSEFIKNHQQELEELYNELGYKLKFFLKDYLGFHHKWQSSMTSFGKNDDLIAGEIPESKLIKEMTDPTGSIKSLLDTAKGDVKLVKPFLPFIMISLNTNTRDKKIMEFKHTGRFVFDFDKIGDEKTTLQWMNKVWKGTKNVKPYMSFVSPSGNGFKLFCQVDSSNAEFVNDFSSEEKNSIETNHKIWYEGARKELASSFPEIAGNIDTATKDPQRLTLLPYIAKKSTHFKYNPKVFSEYSKITKEEKKLRKKELNQKIKKYEAEVNRVMVENSITSKEDAYYLYQRNKSKNFDINFELDKFQKTVDFLVELSKKDARVKIWLKDTFTSYKVLNKQSWVLYGVFGNIAIEELKKLIPVRSNKLDEDDNDYRWTNKSDDSYEDEELRSKITPATFYDKVFEIGEVKRFVLKNFGVTSTHLSDFKLINEYYENYKYNLDLYHNNEDSADSSEFLKKIETHLNMKKIRLPLIKDLEEIEADIKLKPKDYLDKKVMQNLFQNKYTNKKIFALKSQCGILSVPS